MQQLAFSFFERLRLPEIPFNKTLYASLSEAKCAKALERYFPNWKPVYGKTVQVDIHNHHRVDFRVGNNLIEFHPIMPWRDIASTTGLVKLRALYDSLSVEQKKELREGLELELEMQYRKLRRSQLESCKDPVLRSCKLIHVKNEVEFYAKVLAPYSHCQLPSATRWVQMWHENRA